MLRSTLPFAQQRTFLSLLLLSLLTGGCGERFGDLPDLAAIDDVAQMKQSFYDYLEPIVSYQNARIIEQRAQLDTLSREFAEDGDLSWLQRRALRSLAAEYEVSWDRENVSAVIDGLWPRVDIIPPELALVQAAKESGWGRSRFAIEANNIFGQWCYTPGCGLVPERRSASAGHEVETFDSVSESIRRYMNNLNTHERYAPLRRLRASLRREASAITGRALAAGLAAYSERGEPYVAELRSMMQQNRDLLSRAPGA